MWMVNMLPRSLGVMKEVSDGVILFNKCLHRKYANPQRLPWSFILLIVCIIDTLLFPFEIKSREKQWSYAERVEAYWAFTIQDHLLSCGLISNKESTEVVVVITMDIKWIYIKEGSSCCWKWCMVLHTLGTRHVCDGGDSCWSYCFSINISVLLI